MSDITRYPPYKAIANDEAVARGGSFLIDGHAIKVRTKEVMLQEGIEFTDDKLLEEFIINSFQDFISRNVKYHVPNKHTSINLLENSFDVDWQGELTWVIDYAELLLAKVVANKPLGVWKISFHGADSLAVMYQGSIGDMLYDYLRYSNHPAVSPPPDSFTPLRSIEMLKSISLYLQRRPVRDFAVEEKLDDLSGDLVAYNSDYFESVRQKVSELKELRLDDDPELDSLCVSLEEEVERADTPVTEEVIPCELPDHQMLLNYIKYRGQ